MRKLNLNTILILVVLLLTMGIGTAWGQTNLVVPTGCTGAGIPTKLEDSNTVCVITVDKNYGSITVTDPVAMWNKLVFRTAGNFTVNSVALGTSVGLYTVEFQKNSAAPNAVLTINSGFDMVGHKTTIKDGSFVFTETTARAAIRNSGSTAEFQVNNAAVTFNVIEGQNAIATNISRNFYSLLYHQVSNRQVRTHNNLVTSLVQQKEAMGQADGYDTSAYANAFPGFVMNNNVVYDPPKSLYRDWEAGSYKVTLSFNSDGYAYIYDTTGIGNTTFSISTANAYVVEAGGPALTYNWNLPAGATMYAGTLPSPQYVTNAGEQVTVVIPNDVNVNGWQLTGWADSEWASTPQYTAGSKVAVPAGGKTIYGVWDIKELDQYQLVYNKNTTDNVANMPFNTSGPIGSIQQLSTQKPTRANYTFKGWGRTADATTTITSITLTTDPTTVYAIWEGTDPNQYDLIYDANTTDPVANMPQSTKGAKGSTVTLSTQQPGRNNYTFKGWATSSTSKTTVTQVTLNSNPTRVYAVWEGSTPGTTVNLVYNKNTTDTVENMPPNTTGQTGTTVKLSTQQPIRNNYTFKGWAVAASSKVIITDIVLRGNPTNVYAVWEAIPAEQAQLIYDANTTDPVNNMPRNTTGNKGSTVTLSLTRPTRSGWTFKGWATAPDSTSTVGRVTLNDDPTTVYAVWEESTQPQVQLIYSANTLDPVENMPIAVTGDKGSMVQLSGITPTRDGFRFRGWSLDPASGQLVTQVALVNDPTMVYAVWAALPAEQSQLIYDPNSSSGVWGMPGNETGAKGTTKQLSQRVPSRIGYQFEGWALTRDGAPVTEVTLDKSVVRVYALWTEAPAVMVELIYDPNTTDPVENMPAPENVRQHFSTPLSAQVPTRDGYRFMGWVPRPNGVAVIRYIIPQTDPTTVYAKWQKNGTGDNQWFSIYEMFDYDVNFGNPAVPNISLPGTGFPTHGNAVRESVNAALPQTLGFDLMIPVLDVDAPVVMAPRSDSSWAVDQLGANVGLLEGFAMPGEGITMVAAHNHLNETEVGPFLFIRNLEENDYVFLRDESGELARYMVYANEQVQPDNMERVREEASRYDAPLIMVTCEDETPDGTYAFRRVVFARPVEG